MLKIGTAQHSPFLIPSSCFHESVPLCYPTAAERAANCTRSGIWLQTFRCSAEMGDFHLKKKRGGGGFFNFFFFIIFFAGRGSCRCRAGAARCIPRALSGAGRGRDGPTVALAVGKPGRPQRRGTATGGWMGRGVRGSSRPAIRVPPRASTLRNDTNTYKSVWCACVCGEEGGGGGRG